MKTLATSCVFRRCACLLCLSIGVIALSEVAVHGQPASVPAPQPGFQRDHAYFGLLPFESIDAASGSVLLTFADWSLPGYNGMDLVFQRTFNSASGWTFGLAGFPMKVLRPDGPADSGGGPNFTDPAGLPAVVTSDGGMHRTWWDGDSATPSFVTADFWRYHTQGRRLELPSGMECFYDAAGALIEVRDRFINRIEIVNEVVGTGTYPTLIRQRLGDGRIRELALSYATVVYQSVAYRLLTSTAFNGRSWTYQYGGARGIDLVGVNPPISPGWTFLQQYRPDGVPLLMTVTVPQGGQVVYTFADVPSGDPRSGALTTRETREGANITSLWTFDLQNDGGTPAVYRGTFNGPEGVRLVYGHGAGPAQDGDEVLKFREVWDASTNTLVEREDATYTTTEVTDVSGSVRNLVSSAVVSRDSRSYATTLSYQAGDASGHFSDYGRPSRITEVGDAGTRETVRTFNYSISGYLIDRIASATTTVAGESASASWTFNTTTGFVESATRSGITTTFTPNPSTGAVLTVTDPHSHPTNLTYDWGVVKDVATLLHTTTRTINNDGSVASETRRGATINLEYDALGRIRWTKPPLGYWIETQYDLTSARWVQARRNDGQNAGAQTTTSLDSFGRPIATENSLGVRTRTAYDAVGRKSYQSFPFTTTDVGRTYRHDALGRVREIETADGKKVTYGYSNGDVTITDQEGRVTVQDWAAFGSPDDGRLLALRDGENQTWSYAYDVVGHLTRVYQPGGPTREWYYSGDFLVRTVQPESGQTTYSYDSGRLASTTTQRGITFTYGYDANDRLTSINAPGTAYDVTLAYDESDNRTLVENSFSRTLFEYDAANRVTRRRDTLTGQPERQTTYTYDGWDNVTSVTYPSGLLVRYAYDRENRVTNVRRGAEATLVAEVLQYHPSGSPATLRFANNVQETYSFDANRYWLRQIAGGPVQLTYQRDGVGNVQSVTDARSEYSQSFSYDNVNRLRHVWGWAANEYQYDALGNRTVKAAPAVTYAYDTATKRLTSVSGNAQVPEVGSYAYDPDGNLTSDPSGTYTYTPFNMLEAATVGGATATYCYDGDNKRRLRVVPDRTDYFYPGADGSTLSEYTRATGAPEAGLVREYVYLGGRVVASISYR